MALRTCQIQQYDFHHHEQQFEKQCGKGERTLLKTTVGLLFVFSGSTLSCFQNLYNLLQPRRVKEEGVSGRIQPPLDLSASGFTW